MAILVKDGKVLMSDGKILTSQGGSNSNVSLTRKMPIPNKLTIKEFSFDTSKTTEEVDAILSQLSYEDGNDLYRVCEKYSNGWYGIYVRKDFIADFDIIYMDDDVDIILYDSNNGWNLEAIINGKFTVPNEFLVGGCYQNQYGEENYKLIDVLWYDQPIYVPSRENVKLEELNYEYTQYEEIDWKIHTFKFYDRCLDNKNVIINLADYEISSSDDNIDIDFGSPKNCRILFLMNLNFFSFTIWDMLDYKVIVDTTTQSLFNDYPVYFEGTRYPETIGNVFLMFSEQGYYPFNMVIDFDNDGNATITFENSFEF